MSKRVLKTTDVKAQTDWSLLKIRTLIAQGKLKAFNSSTSDRPYWNILQESLDAMLGSSEQKAQPAQVASPRKQRIDANVPKVFG
jgi:hypothetical protein